ncbi:aldo/keto reductase [Gleimia hominis]|uniref:aldo/keto reductase n=1 Tax=Gleimia hominis TaxID=595468 RepID=UPI000C803BEF|nr:aldo/keto reductase [Gleimia hominis]WIK64447.1 aldo/keto reductase [Gleimia hominis]
MTGLNVPTITLNDGHRIPQLGLGTYKVTPEDAARVVREGAGLGYRHFDTAQMYHNEKEVGEGLRAAGLERSEFFLTTKLNNNNHEPDDARRSFDQSLKDLGVDYVDLFLIHWPLPTLYDGDFVSTWKVLEEFHADGRAKSIGVSNFQVDHLQKVLDEGSVKPAINQIEVHPFLPNNEVREFCQSHDIAIEAWSPLARGKVIDDPVLTEVGKAHGKTAGQVALRWAIERGDIVFPKSLRKERMAENADIFDFKLTDKDKHIIEGLDLGEEGRTGSHPDTMDRL